MAIKLAGGEKNIKNVRATLSQLETQWKKIFPETRFDYSFLNESISWLYEPENKTVWLVNVAMGITIFISCMGLFVLGMFTAERRTKEIGIRKVLGASVSGIAGLLSKDFLKLIFISSIIAFPIAWWAMHSWLLNYPYRIDISWWIFLAAGLLAMVIALLTVSFQAIKAATANPVKSLKTE